MPAGPPPLSPLNTAWNAVPARYRCDIREGGKCQMTLPRNVLTFLRCATLFTTLTLVANAQPRDGQTRFFSYGPRMTEFAVIGAPFTSELASETVQTGTDGTHFTRERVLSQESRDSQGRVRTEREVFAGHPDLKLITIWDLVGGYQYVLDTQHRVAHRQAMTIAASEPPQEVYELRKTRWQPSAPGASVLVTREALGTQTIEGVYTEGWKFIRTVQPKVAGNDRPFEVTEERWAAPDMALAFLVKRSDPRFGDETVRRTKLVRAEPAPELFQVPTDYSIVEEPGAFKVVFELPLRPVKVAPSGAGGGSAAPK